MDNITHTLSGALAARVVSNSPDRANARRTLFWLFLVAANLPDVDVVGRFFTDPLTALDFHRGATHSLLVAPLLALLPASIFYRFGKFKNLALLWLCALLGIVIHIFLDLITPFGTQIFLPLSRQRYALDWMFIVDPLFTLIMAAGVWTARRWSGKRSVRIAGVALLAGYLGVEAVSHLAAEAKVSAFARGHGLADARISAIPQPLNMFRWMGVVQTRDGLRRIFFSVFDDTLVAREIPQARSELVRQAMELPEARWYLSYARHPSVQEMRVGDSTAVELRDLQFAVDPAITGMLGLPGREPPFVLRFLYAPSGRLSEVRFDRNVLRRASGGGQADSGK